MIIGIMGLKGSGKNTVADIICKLDPSFKSIAFADTLKDVVSTLFGWDRELLEGKTPESRSWREKKNEFWSSVLGRDFTPRIALQEIGTNVMRDHFCKDIWVNVLKYKLICNSSQNFIITDVRFKNEIDMLKGLGAMFIEVRRPPKPSYWEDASNYNKGITINVPKSIETIHPSEWDWIGYTETDIINNDGTLEELEYKVKELF